MRLPRADAEIRPYASAAGILRLMPKPERLGAAHTKRRDRKSNDFRYHGEQDVGAQRDPLTHIPAHPPTRSPIGNRQSKIANGRR